MALIYVNNRRIRINIREELEEYDFYNERWTSDKLIASSPFRPDNAPSFYVNLETGWWGDSGAYGTEYEKGNIVELLAYLSNTDVESVGHYLLNKYGYETPTDEDDEPQAVRLVLDVERIVPKERPKYVPNIVRQVSPYLTKRKIAEQVQREYVVGYNEDYKGFSAIAWTDEEGRIANVKYRSTKGKRFFYDRGGTPIRNLVYGLYEARYDESVIICEAEIDALSWATAGLRAVATGSARISEVQAEQIRRMGFRKIYVAGDNDEQGRVFNERVSDRLRNSGARLYELKFPDGTKDANDVLIEYGINGLVDMRNTAIGKRVLRLNRM